METTTAHPATRHPGRWVGLVALLVAEAMNLLDATVVQVAAPSIQAGLGGPAAAVPWYGAAYTLPFALLLVTGGRLGDRVGRRRVFVVGVVGFTLASIACAAAPAVAVLIVARALQGAAAAAIVPQTFGLIVAMFTGAERSTALGTIGPVMGLAAICGPVLGATVTAADLAGLSWRAVFLINVPLAVGVLAAARALREDRAEQPPRLHGFDAVLLGLLRRPAFGAALVASTLVFAVMNGLMLVVPLQVQLGEGRGVLAAGLTLLPWTAGSAVASLLAGWWLVPRWGARVMLVGLPALAAGLAGALVTGLGPVVLAVGGVGLGLFTVPFFTAALARVRPAETGSAAGLLNAVQQLGAALGVTVLGGVALHGGPAVAIALVATLVAVVPAVVLTRAARS